MTPVKRGALIVIEGVDRSGKSTQCKNIVSSLKQMNIKASLMNFPDRSTLTGKLINQYLSDKTCNLNDKAIHLLFSANRWENADKIKNLLYDGCTIIVDRYSYSGMVFSAVKKGMDMSWCKHPEIGLPKPDLVFLLNLSEEEIKKRPGFGEERYENSETQKLVSQMFNTLAKVEGNWKIVNAADTIENIKNNMLSEILQVLKNVENEPLKCLNF